MEAGKLIAVSESQSDQVSPWVLMSNLSSDRFAVEFEVRILEGAAQGNCFFGSDNGRQGEFERSIFAKYFYGGLGKTQLQSWGYGKSEWGKSFAFSKTKTATVIVVGDQIASFVDGLLAVTTLHTDGSIAYTRQYLGAENICTCEFDNYKLWDLSEVDFNQ